MNHLANLVGLKLLHAGELLSRPSMRNGDFSGRRINGLPSDGVAGLILEDTR